MLGAAERAARTTAPGSLAAVIAGANEGAGQVVLLVPEAADDGVRRVAESIARELQARCTGFTFAVGHSRVASDPVDLYRAGNEALLAANVAETRPASIDEPSEVLAFEDTGAYRLLLPAMSEDPGELQRFYTETVEPLVAYDAQYETDLVQTLETFLDCDGNVAGTAQKLYTHRHTVRYRLERVRDLSGLDVGSTDGRERLGLGLKAMRVLGIASPAGPRQRGGGGRRARAARRQGPLSSRAPCSVLRETRKGASMATIEQSMDVEVPIETAYNQWTQFEQFPQFMEGVEEIRQLDDRRLHWVADFGGSRHEWEAEITEQSPEERVAWRNTDGKDNAGVVTFHKLADDKTRVMVQMDWVPEGIKEKLGDKLGVADRRVKGDLERFKELIESRGAESGAWRGEVPRDA